MGGVLLPEEIKQVPATAVLGDDGGLSRGAAPDQAHHVRVSAHALHQFHLHAECAHLFHRRKI